MRIGDGVRCYIHTKFKVICFCDVYIYTIAEWSKVKTVCHIDRTIKFYYCYYIHIDHVNLILSENITYG